MLQAKSLCIKNRSLITFQKFIEISSYLNTK